jgi:hypothetical protein
VRAEAVELAGQRGAHLAKDSTSSCRCRIGTADASVGVLDGKGKLNASRRTTRATMLLEDVHLLLYMQSLLDSIEVKYSKLINMLLFVLRVDLGVKRYHGIKRSLHKNKKVDILRSMFTFFFRCALATRRCSCSDTEMIVMKMYMLEDGLG